MMFIAIGRFVAKKGFDLLLDAFKRYTDVATVEARLMIAGSGPLEQMLHNQAKALGIDKLVDFVAGSMMCLHLLTEGIFLFSRPVMNLLVLCF